MLTVRDLREIWGIFILNKHKNFKLMWNIISNFAEKIAGAIAGTIYYSETKNKRNNETTSKGRIQKS